MARRKRKGFAKTGTLTMSLVLALGIIGVAYSSWSDMVTIPVSVETGYTRLQLCDGIGYPFGTVTGWIDGDTLRLTINAPGMGTYYYRFVDIHNTGTIPVKIQDIMIKSSPHTNATCDLGRGVEIEQNGVPGDTVSDNVTIQVLAAGVHTCNGTYSFVNWNQYVP